MGQQELPGGIPSRLTGLSASLVAHLLALAALAADETRALLQRSLVSLFLLVALIISLFVAYFALVVTAIVLLTCYFGWSWLSALGATVLLHLFFAGCLLMILRLRSKSIPFEATSAELRRDLEALRSYSKSSETPPS